MHWWAYWTHTFRPHGLHGTSLRTTRVRDPTGDHSAASFVPLNSATVRVPSAAAMCVGPESFPTIRSARLRRAISSRSESLPDRFRAPPKTAAWLCLDGWTLDTVSFNTAKGNPPRLEQKESLNAALNAAGYPDQPYVMRYSGPDIVARREAMIWRIECKGLGPWKKETVANNFDRGVSQVVSYYDGNPGVRLGLSLPWDNSTDLFQEPSGLGYIQRCADRLPSELRQAIELWVFFVPIYGGGSLDVSSPRDSLSVS